MPSHPNEFTRRIISKFFKDRHLEITITTVADGYVVFINHFSLSEACVIDDPTGKLIFDEGRNQWDLYWISADFRWHPYASYDKLHQALEVVFGDQAANLFHKVL